MSEKEVSVNGLNINYKIAGEGPAILVLHGWGGSSDSWLEVQKILASKGYKIIVPDFPGFGKSRTPLEPWGINNYVEWVKDFTEFLKMENFLIIAHSFGGRVAVRFATIYPDKIKKLILCDSAGVKSKPGPKAMIIYILARIGNAVFTPRHLMRFKDSVRNIFYKFLRNKDYVKANGVMKETIKKVLEEDLLLDLPKIKNKTLIIWGEADRMVPVKFAQVFKENIQSSKLEILPKIGHSPHLEVPDEFSKIVIKFLNE